MSTTGRFTQTTGTTTDGEGTTRSMGTGIQLHLQAGQNGTGRSGNSTKSEFELKDLEVDVEKGEKQVPTSELEK